MKPADALAGAMASLSGHKLRSALAMLGVVFGVGAVIAMLSVGAGAERQALEMIQRLGLNNILIRAGDFTTEELREIRQTSIGLSQRDLDAILAAVPDVELAGPRVEIDAWEVRSDHAGMEAVSVFGVAAEHRSISDVHVVEGRFLDAIDVRDHAQVCVIGPEVRRQLFGWRPAIGAELEINDVWLTVVGVVAGSGGESDSFRGISLASTESAVYVPVTTSLRKFDRSPLESPFSEIVVRVRDADDSGAATLAAAASIENLLGQLHGGADDVELVVPQALLEQSRQTQRLFGLVMGSMAGIALLVGGIGIMNIMLATVMERRREIGIRQAIGARKVDIWIQFLAESFTISALGGAVGILAGVALSRGIAAYAGWPTSVNLTGIGVSAAVAIVVGVASGLYPAAQAAELEPLESIRYG